MRRRVIAALIGAVLSLGGIAAQQALSTPSGPPEWVDANGRVVDSKLPEWLPVSGPDGIVVGCVRSHDLFQADVHSGSRPDPQVFDCETKKRVNYEIPGDEDAVQEVVEPTE